MSIVAIGSLIGLSYDHDYENCPVSYDDRSCDHDNNGFSGGYFGRDSYDNKRVEAMGVDWLVAREVDSQNPVFYHGNPQRLAQYLDPDQ